MRYYRILKKPLSKHFNKFKQAIVLMGPRQAGKTTLLKDVFKDAIYLLVDEEPIREALESYSSASYKNLIKKSGVVIIDEAHLLTDPGRAAKIIYDKFPGIKLILTGSSSLRIKNKISESMAGRAIDYYLYPLTFSEMLYQLEVEDDVEKTIIKRILNNNLNDFVGTYDLNFWLSEVLVYGLYPEVLNLEYGPKEEYLRNLGDKAIFKDIIELDLIEKRSVAYKLLVLLAYQIGNIINYAELARNLGTSIPTIQRYIEIFEQSFVIYRVYPFSKNKRKEIVKSPKIYFWDVGLRNALIDDFSRIKQRGDVGALFENFIVSEVKKEIRYFNINWNINYWRLKTGTEVDLVLSSRDGKKIIGCEIKFNKSRFPKSFLSSYPEARTCVLTSRNFWG